MHMYTYMNRHKHTRYSQRVSDPGVIGVLVKDHLVFPGSQGRRPFVLQQLLPPPGEGVPREGAHSLSCREKYRKTKKLIIGKELCTYGSNVHSRDCRPGFDSRTGREVGVSRTVYLLELANPVVA